MSWFYYYVTSVHWYSSILWHLKSFPASIWKLFKYLKRIVSFLFSFQSKGFLLGDGFQIFVCYVYNVVVLNQGQFCSPGDIWQCLETFLVITTGRLLLAPSGWSPGMLLNILQCTGQLPTQRSILSKISALMLKNPGLLDLIINLFLFLVSLMVGNSSMRY